MLYFFPFLHLSQVAVIIVVTMAEPQTQGQDVRDAQTRASTVDQDTSNTDEILPAVEAHRLSLANRELKKQKFQAYVRNTISQTVGNGMQGGYLWATVRLSLKMSKGLDHMDVQKIINEEYQRYADKGYECRPNKTTDEDVQTGVVSWKLSPVAHS
jgi:hypothetical protein